MMQATQTDVGDWAYPVTRNVEVRALPQPNAPAIEELAMILLRAMPEDGSNIPANRHTGRQDRLCAGGLRAPIGNDQVCYVKDASGWKIGSYIGGGDTQ